ncbi:MAG: response regulator, partial [Ruminococcus sp.]|nr:response regulator [Ruminococcus sp.]
MLDSHKKFHSADGKRLLLVADDEFINRELLKAMLSDDYNVITCEDGLEALEKTRENSSKLSLVILDLQMPGMSGMEVLTKIREDEETKNIPVIVMTSDQQSEIECFEMGAMDFIPKPYPDKEIILARLRRTIELNEDRQIIMVTERDHLTGLYNADYFYRYAEQYDMYHADMEMDAIIVDINHFHMMNERFGREYSDEVLKRVGAAILEFIGKDGGIVGRREADTFLAYGPHKEDYMPILTNVANEFSGEGAQNRIRLRIGVYPNVDKTIEIERRFDHAKMAADNIKNRVSQTIAFYDKQLHESELYDEQLIDDFRKAIDEHQFTVFYQPKFDVRPEIPVLYSAEALVRWQHPELGFISPGSFISLFEENGLIRELDAYVWRETAAQIKDWRDRFGITVPVSVNVSRVD